MQHPFIFFKSMNTNQLTSLIELVTESANLVKPFKKIDETYNPESLSFPITQEPSKWIRQLTIAFQNYTDLLLNGHNDYLISEFMKFEPRVRFDRIKWNVLSDFLDAQDPDDEEEMSDNDRQFIEMVTFRLTRNLLEKILNHQSKK